MSQSDNSRIAKNTLILYCRTLFVMIISLFTCRVTLQALGLDNYGVQNAVGGVIGMFGVVSGALSKSISRYITFELGRGDTEKLNRIFSTGLNIQIGIGIILLILGETLGVWFLNHKMVIPVGREYAANCVLQCSMLSFVINLTGVPYSACIIGHEKMNIFAWFSLCEVVLQLVIVYMLYISPFDRLVTISVLSLIVAIIIRVAYIVICRRMFQECHYHRVNDFRLLKEMTGFASWSFLTNTAWIFNTQGINVLINLFFGVQFNAARGVAAKIEGLATKFSGDFMTAFNPQITKTYAAGEIDSFFKLICRGSRFCFFLLFAISLPFMFEAQFVLELWLGEVPDYTVVFFRLSMIATMLTSLGSTGVTACMATGRIKWYTIIITSIGLFVFPLTWILYHLGYPVESCYYVYIAVYFVIHFVRLVIMKYIIHLPIHVFVRDVWAKILPVTLLSLILPVTLRYFLRDSSWSSILVMVVAILSACFFAFFIGFTKSERNTVLLKIKSIIGKYSGICH